MKPLPLQSPLERSALHDKLAALVSTLEQMTIADFSREQEEMQNGLTSITNVLETLTLHGDEQELRVDVRALNNLLERISMNGDTASDGQGVLERGDSEADTLANTLLVLRSQLRQLRNDDIALRRDLNKVTKEISSHKKKSGRARKGRRQATAATEDFRAGSGKWKTKRKGPSDEKVYELSRQRHLLKRQEKKNRSLRKSVNARCDDVADLDHFDQT